MARAKAKTKARVKRNPAGNTAAVDIVGSIPIVQEVVRILSPAIPCRISRDDLRSAGYLSLVQAASVYPKSRAAARGIPFAAYARVCIRRSIQREAMYLNGQCSQHGHVEHGSRVEPTAGDRVNRLEYLARVVDDAVSPFRTEYIRFRRIVRSSGVSRLQAKILYRHFYHGRPLRSIASELGIGAMLCALEFARAKQKIRESAFSADHP